MYYLHICSCLWTSLTTTATTTSTNNLQFIWPKASGYAFHQIIIIVKLFYVSFPCTGVIKVTNIYGEKIFFRLKLHQLWMAFDLPLFCNRWPLYTTVSLLCPSQSILLNFASINTLLYSLHTSHKFLNASYLEYYSSLIFLWARFELWFILCYQVSLQLHTPATVLNKKYNNNGVNLWYNVSGFKKRGIVNDISSSPEPICILSIPKRHTVLSLAAGFEFRM